MKHIYDQFDDARHRRETWVGICAFVFLGFCIAWSLGGCVKRPHDHIHDPQCWHGARFTENELGCSLPYESVKDSTLHCAKVRCRICGKYLKK